MSIAARSLFAALLIVPFLAGCNVELEGEEPTPVEEGSTVHAQSACTAQAVCGTCTTLSCSGSSACYAADGANGYVNCDGVQRSCQTCTFNGVTYTDGQKVAGGPSAGVYCTSKVNGYCSGGVFAGKPCVASGECYATCCNGTWQ